MSGDRLCALEDIPDGGSAGFAAVVDGQPVELMAIRRGGEVFVYVNSCPHWGSPLDLCPGRFLNRQRTLIQCSTHGAQFRIEDGFCIKGPCLGASLQPVHCVVVDGEVLKVTDAGPWDTAVVAGVPAAGNDQSNVSALASRKKGPILMS